MNYELNLNDDTKSDLPYKIIAFPDGHKHIDLGNGSMVIPRLQDLTIHTRIVTMDDIFILMQITDAIRYINPKVKFTLRITYLIGARYDRRMYAGDSFDLKIIAKLINDMNFEKVLVMEPHSDKVTTLINNCHVLTPIDFPSLSVINEYVITDEKGDKAEVVIVAPDLGAIKRAENYAKQWSDPKQVVYMNKNRDLKTGDILGIEIIKSPDLVDKVCVIYDDLCDGGRTFIEAAKVLRAQGALKVLLVVTHGLFTQGAGALTVVKHGGGYLDKIITTNSYQNLKSTASMLVVNVN